MLDIKQIRREPEVVKAALGHNAAAVILAHNHPSGVAEPSQADELITVRIRDALAKKKRNAGRGRR